MSNPSRSIACPFCMAAAGAPCVTKTGATLSLEHLHRVQALRASMSSEDWQRMRPAMIGRNRFRLRAEALARKPNGA